MHVPTFRYLVCLLAIWQSAAGDSIVLKNAARLPADSLVVTLGDVAVLEGDEALRLAGTPVGRINPGESVRELTLADVRESLSRTEVNWARVNISGRSVVVRVARDAHAAPPQAMAPATLDVAGRDSQPAPGETQAVVLDTLVAEPTIRGLVAKLICTGARRDPRDLRVRFDDRDSALLSTRLDSGRFEVQPLGSLSGDRMEFAVRAWEGAAARHAGQVTLLAEFRTSVARVRTDMDRDRVVADDDIEVSESWVGPSEAMSIAPRAAIVGRVLARSVRAGDILRVRDLQNETLVQRGDLVTVRCLVGGVAISLQAEARADGAQGEAIEFRKTGEREAFLATVTGRNQAIIDLSHKQGAP
jgi:flagella basal body P-ring formation protein FlgA